MNKSILITLVCFFLGIIIGFCIHSHSMKTTEEDIAFTYEGEATIKKFPYERNGIDTKDAYPYGEYNKTEGIIPTPQDAARFAEVALSPIYGKEHIIGERPYSIRLINNTIWSINGTLDARAEGGTFHISIDKRNGRVRSIYHDK